MVIALVSDLIFSTRITGTAQKLGSECRVVRSTDALAAGLAGEVSPLVLVDLNVDGLSGVDAVRLVRATRPECRVVAFLSHVQTDLAAEAREAGADEVLPRSAFVQRLPDLLSGRLPT